MKVPIECQTLISLLSLLVPVEKREDWRREWLSEVWHWWASSPQDIDSRILVFTHCLGAWYDARYLREDRSPGITARPEFAIGFVFALLVAVVLTSHGLRISRRVIGELSYPFPEQIATVSQPGRLIARDGVPVGKIPAWREQVAGISGIEGYRWDKITVECGGKKREVVRSQVTPGFFPLLGQPQFPLEASSAVVRASFGVGCADLSIAGRRFRIAGTVPDDFWFLDDSVVVWTLLPWERVNSARMSGAVLRLKPGATVADVQERLRRVAERTGYWPHGKRAEVAPLAPRLRQPLLFYGCSWLLMMIAAVAWCMWFDRTRTGWFFLAKFGVLVTAVVLSVVEFTGAAYVGMYGGAVFAGEPGAIWLFVVGCCGALWLSVLDQRMRCRECLTRLQLPARIGLPGNLLFGTAGTELVCWYGHGTLYVDEKPENVHEKDRWIRLDDSWRDLFVQRSR